MKTGGGVGYSWEMGELTQDQKSGRFYKVLRDHSRDKFDPVSEWRFNGDKAGDGCGRCICSTPIVHEYVIENILTGETITIGSECIQRWFESKIKCKKCNASLGNVSMRIRKDNFICGKCNRENKKRQRELQTNRIFFFPHQKGMYPLYEYRMFMDIIDDEVAVERLINIPDKTQSLIWFEEYANLVYKIETQEV